MLHPLRIVFIGTPDFALASLDAMYQKGYHIAGVITAPDKPAGRGMHMHESAVKKYAAEKGLHLMQPANLKAPEFIEELKALNADLQVVIAFRMLPEIVWNMPRLGTFNLHASLLPQYRGAAPINWAIINGEKETGITTFFLKHEIDTGQIILQEKVSIGENTTAGELHDELMLKGAQLVVKTLDRIESSNYPSFEQDLSQPLKHAPKIFTQHCQLNWNNQVHHLHNQIRGLSPHPAALSTLNEKVLKVYRSKPELVNHTFASGTFISDGKSFIKVAASDGFIHLLELQLEGKRKMNAEEFLRGYNKTKLTII